MKLYTYRASTLLFPSFCVDYSLFYFLKYSALLVWLIVKLVTLNNFGKLVAWSYKKQFVSVINTVTSFCENVLKIGCNMYLTRLLKKTLCSPSQLRCFFTKPPDFPLLSRCDNINNLKNDEFDVVVIGGGCVGAGCALDAATRGLRTALIERSDFASGTSGKSTKLIHGGVRYLQQAFENRDLQQIKILLEALQERSQLLKMAPHLTKEIPIVVTLRK